MALEYLVRKNLPNIKFLRTVCGDHSSSSQQFSAIMPIYRSIQLERSFTGKHYVIKEDIIIIISTHHFVAKLNSSIRIIFR